MDTEPLVAEQVDAGEEFAREFNNHVPVAAAFWINPADSETWYLYLASTEITDENKRESYAEVLQRLKDSGIRWLDAMQVRLVNAADQLPAKIIEIRDRYPARVAAYYNGSSVAGMAINGAYIYPPIEAVSSNPS